MANLVWVVKFPTPNADILNLGRLRHRTNPQHTYQSYFVGFPVTQPRIWARVQNWLSGQDNTEIKNSNLTE